MRKEKKIVIQREHFGFGPVLQTVLFTSKSEQSCFVLCAKHGLCQADELASLGWSQCLTPPDPPLHPSTSLLAIHTTHSPSPNLQQHLVIIHLRILKLKQLSLHPSSLRFPPTGHSLLHFSFCLKRIVVDVFSGTVEDDPSRGCKNLSLAETREL